MMTKEIVPPPPAILRNDVAAVQALFQQHVVPSYGRFDIVLSHGVGSYLYDVKGKRYLDLGGGIAVNALGHAHPAITQALVEQSRRLIHASNFYYHEPQGRLAQRLVRLIGPGKCFFCNSGVEANEGLFKLARKFGHDEGRFEILTTDNSFHGRTLAGIAATGQEKIKKGFGPTVPGFRQVPYNDLAAMRAAVSPATAAIMVEGIQGEGGVTPASEQYLLGLRALCDEKRLLLFMDSVQCGHFRSGRFQSFQRILESAGEGFLPDGISMAKSLGGGFPIGAFWVREKFAELLSAGTHASTFGGTPLGCAVALKILDVIARDHLAENARRIGDFLIGELEHLRQKYPRVLRAVRGFGLMIGIDFDPNAAVFAPDEKSPAIQVVNRLHNRNLLTVPAANSAVRLLPALNLSQSEAEEGLHAIASTIADLA